MHSPRFPKFKNGNDKNKIYKSITEIIEIPACVQSITPITLQTLQLLQFVKFSVTVSRIASGNVMKIIALLLISIQKFLPLETALNFLKANNCFASCTCSQLLPCNSYAFVCWYAFRKMVSFFLTLRETKSTNFRSMTSLIRRSSRCLF